MLRWNSIVVMALLVFGILGESHAADSADELVMKLRKQASQSRQTLNEVSALDQDIGELLQVVKDSAVMGKSQLNQFEKVAGTVKEVRNDRLNVVVEVLSGVNAKGSNANQAVDRALKENRAAADLMKAALEVSRLNAMRAKQASGLALLIQEQEALRGQTLLESRMVLEGGELQGSKISELSQNQQKIAQGIGRVLEGQEPVKRLQAAASDIVVVINNAKLLDALKKQAALIKELKLLNKQAESDAQKSDAEKSAEELAKEDPLSQKIAELNEKIEEQGEKIDEFGDEFNGEADELNADGDFNELQANQEDLQKEASDIAESAEGDVQDMMQQAQEQMQKAQEQMQQGDFEGAAEANKSAQEMMKKAAQEQMQQLAQQEQTGEQAEGEKQDGEQAEGEKQDGEQAEGDGEKPDGEQAKGEGEKPDGQPQPGQQQPGEKVPGEAEPNTMPPLQQDDMAEVDDTEPNLMSNQLKLGRNVIEEKTWVKKAGADYERSVQQGMEQKAPPQFANQSQAYFEALAVME